MKDVTESPKDVHDFWYNSEDNIPTQTKHNYNELVDHLVSTMTPIPNTDNTERTPSPYNIRQPFIPQKVTTSDRKSFDELYNEYSAMSIPEQLNNLKELGRDLFNKLDKIIDQLDTTNEEDNDTK